MLAGQKNDGTVVDWKSMGPPPPSMPEGGRYNRPGSTVLYLCDCADGIRRELESDDIFVQQYEVPVASLRIADLCERVPGNIGAAFDFAESSNVPGRTGRADYEFSQFLAELVRTAGFNGMAIPGVRGSDSLHYRNIVIFEFENWRTWSCREGMSQV
jgi:hypothetical protein